METGYMPRWDPVPSNWAYNVSSGEGWVRVEQPFPGGVSDQSFSFGTSAGEPIQEPVMVRIIAHVLLNMLPDQGVYEALESLNRMRDYYAVPPAIPALAEAAGRKRLKAKMSGRIERPAIHIDSE